ncbi:MAG: hypothetical protein U0105_01050 [Candidatus Obscuribacterales bacterium]
MESLNKKSNPEVKKDDDKAPETHNCKNGVCTVQWKPVRPAA